MKPAESQQNRSRSYQKSRYYARKKAATRRGMAGISRRDRAGWAAMEWREAVLKVLGGISKLSPQRLMLLDTLTLRVYRWSLIAAWITGGKKGDRIFDKRRKKSYPLMAELDTLESGIYRDLDRLGWDKRQPPPFWQR